MRFFTALLALAPVALGLQDNKFYETDIYPNGTLVTYDGTTGAFVETLTEGPLVDAYREAFADKARKQRHQLSKRFVSCWGTVLDKSGVDDAVSAWKNYLSESQRTICAEAGKTKMISYVRETMRVYYCINVKKYQCGSIDLNDLNHALSQMDANCARYTASYYQWDGTPEIFGKANTNTAVCLG